MKNLRLIPLTLLALLLALPLGLNAQDEGSIAVDLENGKFTATNASGTYAATWTSNSSEPQLTLSIGVNNMAARGNNIALYYTPANGAGTYTLNVSQGYVITGYSFNFANDTQTNNMTITPSAGGEAATCDGAGSARIEVSGTESNVLSFSVRPATSAVVVATVSDFVVSYRKSEEGDSERQYLFYTFDNNSNIPYRIPAIATAHNGDIIALADYRYCGADIGYGHIDIVGRISSDNGATWGEKFVVADGNGIAGDAACGYGDAAIVADCESDTLLLVCGTGNVTYWNTTRENPLRQARLYSYDGGKTWTEPEDITEQIYSIFDSRPDGPVTGLFFASGRICQSRTIKVGSHYRLYAALCTRQGNFVIYSDDLGRKWKNLGKLKPSPAEKGDEPKCEELPNGNVLLSSRASGGRYFNIYTYTNPVKATGSWKSNAVHSSQQEGGIAVGANSTNGEVYCLRSLRQADGDTVYVMLQSLPAAATRADVTIFYKELASPEEYDTPANFAAGWDGSYRVSYTSSAYSTMTIQADGRIGFFYEEAPNSYSLVYVPLTLEEITGGAYSLLPEPLPQEPVKIEEEAALPFEIAGGRGTLTITPRHSTQVSVCTLTGEQIYDRHAEAQKSITLSLPAGIYIVNDKKVTVK